jgi:glycosyltransferase involved in cell wall biosynthesis
MFPKVSVILPLYNQEAFIVQSLQSAFAQTHPPLEIIAVDDGSTDRTPELLRSFSSRLKHLSQPNRGISAARNRGVAQSSGDLLTFLDGDDLWPENRLAAMAEAFRRDPGLDVLFGQARQFSHDPAASSPPLDARCAGGMMIRREAFLKAGAFPEDLKIAEFLSWYLRLEECGLKIGTLEEVVLFRRVHASNHGIKNRHLLTSEYAGVLKAALDRRRNLN